MVCGFVTYLVSHLTFQGGKSVVSSNSVLLIFHVTLGCHSVPLPVS